MSSLLTYVEKAMLLASLASSSGYASAPSKPSTEKSFFWLGVALVVVSYLLFIAGLGLYLAENYRLPIALMVTGLVMLFTVLCVVASVRCYKTARQRKMQNAVKSATSDITNVLSGFSNDVAGAYKKNAGIVAAVVAFIGFLSTRKII